MKKYILLIFIMFVFCMGDNVIAIEDNANVQFDETSVIVMLKPRGVRMSLYSASSVFDELGIERIENLDEVPSGDISLFGMTAQEQILKLTLKEAGRDNVLRTVEYLEALPEIAFAEPNYIYDLFGLPDDKYYNSGNQYGLDRINAPDVWNMNIDCGDIAVAVIDSGVMINHPDLADNIWTNTCEIPGNGIDDDNNGYIDDVHGWNFCNNSNDVSDGKGHGTHVAGIVSAVTNNGRGVASLARNAKIVPLKVFNDAGKTSTEWIYKAVKYVEKMGFPIVNNSYGGSERSEAMLKAITDCASSLFVAAAGNDASDNDVVPVYPASYDADNVVAVAATNNNDILSVFKKTDGTQGGSNYGKNSVDIAAPGSDILSTYCNKGAAAYASMGGTSMAAPMVASAAALMKAKYGDMTPSQMIDKLESSSDRAETLNDKTKTGARLNAYEALLVRAQNIELDHSSIIMDKGEVFRINAEPYPLNTTDDILWKSSDINIVTVNDGEVTAKEYGTASITVNCGTVSAVCEVVVASPSPSPVPTLTPTLIPTSTPAPSPAPTLTSTPIPTSPPAPSPAPTLTSTPIPTSPPVPSPAPTLTPTSIPTSSPVPSATLIPTSEPIQIECKGNLFSIMLNLSDYENRGAMLFVAIKEAGELKALFVPKITDMYAEFQIPESMANMEAVVYLWDRYCEPYVDPIYLKSLAG